MAFDPEFDEAARSHDPYEALRLGSYRRFLAANILATVGVEMQLVAVGWELYARTHSSLSLGYVGLAQVIPVFLFALPAGQAADRHSRKGLMILSQAIMALASLGLTTLSATRGPIFLMYACLVLTGIAHAVSMPARWSILRQLVPDHLVGSAVTWNSSGWQVAAVLGPALGGAVIAATGGATAAYLLDLLASLAVLALLSGIRPAEVERDEAPPTFRSLLAGLEFVRRTDLILATITLDLFAVLLGGAVTLLPVFAHDILDVGPRGLGLLRAAPSVGAALMGLTLAHRPPLRRAGPALLVAVAGFGLATIGFGLSHSVAFSFLMLLLTGAFDNISVVVRSTLVQVLTPESMRGRVQAINAIFIGSSNELGGFESGLTAQWFGPVASVVGGGVGTLFVVVLVLFRWPEVRALGELHKVRPAQTNPTAATAVEVATS